MKSFLVSWVICLLVDVSFGRIHKLELKNDTRKSFPLSTFGFYKGGILDVQLKDFQFSPAEESFTFVFSLDKTINDNIDTYRDTHQEQCILPAKAIQEDPSVAVIYFTMDFKNKTMRLRCSQHLQHVFISQDSSQIKNLLQGRAHSKGHPDNIRMNPNRRKRNWSDSSLIGSRNLFRRTIREVKEESNEAGKTAEEKKMKTDVGEQSPVKKEVHHSENVKKSQDKAEHEVEDGHENKAKNTNSETNKSKSVKEKPKENSKDRCSEYVFHINNKKGHYSTGFALYVSDETEEGLYNLYFHNCPNYSRDKKVSVSFTIEITEENNGNYLSAGEMPLPALCFTMAILFFLSGCFWVFILRKSKSEKVFKIHYMMVVLVYLKSFSLLFRGINYHFIQLEGIHIEAWAVLFYITHLLKGALLFITIVLIGTGWAFIKHILSEKDKKIFMIVIPLQVLSNVAQIIIEESEEGEVEHSTWKKIFFLVDFLCCGAILFPVVWSIRHLQEASQTDGKAAINLRKLKLFRHFYIMIVCYIYFARIIVYLLGMTVPFPYEWLDDMFREMATFVFFVLTGYKFRPASNNPYFQVPQEDDLEMDMVITQTGLTEGLTKISRTKNRGGTRVVEKVAEEDEEVDSAQLLRRDSGRELD